jgi:hypothetical protein
MSVLYSTVCISSAFYSTTAVQREEGEGEGGGGVIDSPIGPTSPSAQQNRVGGYTGKYFRNTPEIWPFGHSFSFERKGTGTRFILTMKDTERWRGGRCTVLYSSYNPSWPGRFTLVTEEGGGTREAARGFSLWRFAVLSGPKFGRNPYSGGQTSLPKRLWFKLHGGWL